MDHDPNTEEEDQAGADGVGELPSAADASRSLGERIADEQTFASLETAPEPPPQAEPWVIAEARSGSAVWPEADAVSSAPPPDFAPVVDADGEDSTPAPSSRSRLLLALVGAVGALLVLALIGSGYLAFDNKQRADRWHAHAMTLERNVDELNGILAERSQLLNTRTRELNRIATTVRRQERALVRSEADVSSLERRQRALAAEKARVEDDRSALAAQSRTLENVAAAFVECKGDLIRLLGYVLDEYYSLASAAIADASNSCGYAPEALANYNARY